MKKRLISAVLLVVTLVTLALGSVVASANSNLPSVSIAPFNILLPEKGDR